MQPTSKDARIAGGLYLLIALTAPFSLKYVPSTLIVPGSAVATAQKILANETLFRMGMAANLVSMTVFLLVVVRLYRLFRGVSQTQAALMAILVLVSIPVSLVTVMSELAALTLFRGPAYLAAFDPRQAEALAMLFLSLRRAGLIVEQAFWGLWLFPFGWLVVKSRFLPRILGILLLVNGFAYVCVSFTALLAPDYSAVVGRWAFVPMLGELWVMLWLLIKGIKTEPQAVAAA